MDAKYLGKAINLPKDAHAELEAVRAQLGQQFGFTPSLSETVRFLIKHWKESRPAAD